MDAFTSNWEEEEDGGFGDEGPGGAFWAEEKGSPIDELLSASDPAPLDLFLGEPTILQEITGHNTDLLRYLETRLDLLLDYALLGAPAGEEHVELYSQVAFEILHANTSELSEQILNSPALLARLFQLLALPAPLPSARLAGNFHMLLATLCSRDAKSVLEFASQPVSQPVHKPKTVPELIQVFEHHQVDNTSPVVVAAAATVEEPEPLILAFLRHLETTAVTSALICLMQVAFQLESLQEDASALDRSDRDFSAWQGAHGTAERLLARLPTCPHNASEVLIELYGLAASRAKEMQERDLVTSFAALIDEDSSPPTTQTETKAKWTAGLIAEMCHLAASPSTTITTRVALLTVLHEVVQVFTVQFTGAQDFGAKELEQLLDGLGTLNDYFANNAQPSPLRLGMERLVYSSLVCEFVLSGHGALVRELPVACLEQIFDWFFQYEQNNLLHCSVMRALRAILGGIKPMDEQQQHHLQQQQSQRRTMLYMDTNNSSGALEAVNSEKLATLQALECLQEALLCPTNKCQLLSRVLKCVKDYPLIEQDSAVVLEENYFTLPSNGNGVTPAPNRAKKPYRPAFMGHVRIMATDLSSLIDLQMEESETNCGYAFDLLRQAPELAQEWHDFVAGPLAEANQRIKRPLGSSSSYGAAGATSRKPRSTGASGSAAPRLRSQGPRSTFIGTLSAADSESLKRLNQDLNPNVDEDDEDDDDDDEEDGDEVMLRYYARSQEIANANAAAVATLTHDPFTGSEWDNGPTPVTANSFPEAWVQDDDDDDDDDAEEEEEEEQVEPVKPPKKTDAVPIPSNSIAGKKRPQELLGVSPSWVTSFEHEDDTNNST
ncbi:hypothetical protein BASA81_001298 [Batrachochytrium salamandrivorans]|nr:hypothetical protein BASA81_001298 [Batrachochytrium salamandrivorans]